MRVDKLFEGESIPISKESVFRFPLSGLKGFDPKILFSDKQFEGADRLILAFALIYNDFKTTLQFVSMMDELRVGRSGNVEPDKHLGQNTGIQNWLSRIQMAILNELVVLLKANEELVQKRPFEAAVAKLDARNLKLWNLLLELAEIRKPNDEWVKKLRLFLVKVRSHSTFHYEFSKPLAEGYRSFFESKSEASKAHAYFSAGESLEQSRFYFADAAVQAQQAKMIGEISTGVDEFYEKFRKYIDATHSALFHMIFAYFNLRGVEIVELES